MFPCSLCRWVLLKLQVTNPRFCSLRTRYVRHSTALFSAYPECSVKRNLKYHHGITTKRKKKKKRKRLLKILYTNKRTVVLPTFWNALKTNFSNTKYNKITFIKYNFSPFTLFFKGLVSYAFQAWESVKYLLTWTDFFFLIHNLRAWRVLTRVQSLNKEYSCLL